ncbi:hypothetical protein CIK05_04970 [Bdellovibrio sp. qaytius]|nr:hypothetical protein CIK05_04970 [Bdellovibrio sp. qaytius]
MSKLSLFSVVSMFMVLFTLTNQAHAQSMCVDMFKEDQSTALINKMVEVQNSDSTAEFKKIDQKIRNLEKRIRLYSELTGSETNRSMVEAESYTSKIKDQVRLGLTNKVVEKIGPLFKRYEVDIRFSQKLKAEISYLTKLQAGETSETKKNQIAALIKGKQAESNVLDKLIGQNYYRYITLKEALAQMSQSKVAIVSERAQEVLLELESLSTNHAATYGLKFEKMDAADVKLYVQSNIRTQHALLKKAAVDEFFLMLRLMTFSGPILNAVKSGIYKIPEQIVMGPFIVPARKVISEAFQVGFNAHLRSNYLEDIEMIIEANSPVEQYELLRSLNVKSERPDELIELFSRVVENTEEWEAIKSVALTKSTESDRAKLFYDRIMAADKRALEKDAFPMYYQEPGATAFGKLILGTYVGGYIGNKYLEAHPEVTQSFFDGLHTFTTMIHHLF